MKRLILKLWGYNLIRTERISEAEQARRIASWRAVFGDGIEVTQAD